MWVLFSVRMMFCLCDFLPGCSIRLRTSNNASAVFMKASTAPGVHRLQLGSPPPPPRSSNPAFSIPPRWQHRHSRAWHEEENPSESLGDRHRQDGVFTVSRPPFCSPALQSEPLSSVLALHPSLTLHIFLSALCCLFPSLHHSSRPPVYVTVLTHIPLHSLSDGLSSFISISYIWHVLSPQLSPFPTIITPLGPFEGEQITLTRWVEDFHTDTTGKIWLKIKVWLTKLRQDCPPNTTPASEHVPPTDM